MDQAKLNQIYQQLNPAYDPSRQSIAQQQAQLPQQYSSQLAGLEQAKANAFRDISSKARGMGVAFGGYSPSEQARYTGATYLPAVGQLKTAQQQSMNSLQSALDAVNKEQRLQAMGLYQQEQDRAAAERAAAAAAAPSFGGLDLNTILGGGQVEERGPYYETDKKKGWNFFDATGAPVRAYTFSQMTGGSFRSLLAKMSKAGDKNAAIALKYVGDDGVYGNIPLSAKSALQAVGARQASWGKVTGAVTNLSGQQIPARSVTFPSQTIRQLTPRELGILERRG